MFCDNACGTLLNSKSLLTLTLHGVGLKDLISDKLENFLVIYMKQDLQNFLKIWPFFIAVYHFSSFSLSILPIFLDSNWKFPYSHWKIDLFRTFKSTMHVSYPIYRTPEYIEVAYGFTDVQKCISSFAWLQKCLQLDAYLIELLGGQNNLTILPKHFFSMGEWPETNTSTILGSLLTGLVHAFWVTVGHHSIVQSVWIPCG